MAESKKKSSEKGTEKPAQSLKESREAAAGRVDAKADAARVDAYQIIKYPLSTEKSIRQIEFDNKLVFVVHQRATKEDVKKAVEEIFKVRVVKVNILNSFNGEKKAYVKLGPENVASDVSADLGLI